MKVDASVSIYTMLRWPKVTENPAENLNSQNILFFCHLLWGDLTLCVGSDNAKKTMNTCNTPAIRTLVLNSSLHRLKFHLIVLTLHIKVMRLFPHLILGIDL